MLLGDPSRLWLLSTRWHKRGWLRRARAVKLYNFVLFKAVLPPEADLKGLVRLGHFGVGVVVHPNVSIGDDVLIWHGVTLSVGDSPGSSTRLVIGDRVTLGAGAAVIGRERRNLVIASDIKVGANAVVVSDCERPGTYVGVPARRLGAEGNT